MVKIFNKYLIKSMKYLTWISSVKKYKIKYLLRKLDFYNTNDTK